MKEKIIINILITILLGVFSFLINKYFAVYLGIEKLGLMKLFTQMLAYLNLLEIGLSSASAYAFYKPLAEKDYKKVSIVFSTVESLYKNIFLLIFLLGLVFNLALPLIIKDRVIDINIFLYWTLYVTSTAINYLYVKYSILFVADQNYIFVRLVDGGSRIFCQILQILIIIKYKSFLFFIMILILGNIIQYILYKLYYKRNYKNIKKIPERDDSIIKNLKNLFWHKFAGLIVYNTDLILISKFISLEVVGLYSSYLMIIQILVSTINIFLNVLKPTVGKFIVENNKEENFQYFKKLNILFLGVSIVITFSTYYLINSFVYLWLGNEFILPKSTTNLILINLFIFSFRGTLDIFKDGFGFFDDIELPILEAFINFVISVVLVQIAGLNGVVIGTITSNILIICIAKPILVFKRCFNRKVKDYLKLYGGYFILMSLIFILFNFIINFVELGIVYSWKQWLIQASIIGVTCFILTFIVFLFDNEYRNIIKKLIKI